MEHSDKAAVGNEQEGFVFGGRTGLELINQVVDSLCHTQHGFATLVVAGKLFFCFEKHAWMLLPFVAFKLAKVLFYKAGFKGKWQAVFLCNDTGSLRSTAKRRMKNHVYGNLFFLYLFCKRVGLLDSFLIKGNVRNTLNLTFCVPLGLPMAGNINVTAHAATISQIRKTLQADRPTQVISRVSMTAERASMNERKSQ